jgi:hypothetical protein
MGSRKYTKPGELLGLKLTQAERKLILDDPISIHDELADPIRSTPSGAPVRLSLDDLEDLGGYVAAEANHTSDTRLRKKLDAIFLKINHLLELHTDEEPPKSLRFEEAQRERQLAEHTVQVAEWAATGLIAAEQLGIKNQQVARFPLTLESQAVLLTVPTLNEKIRAQFADKNPKLTVGEVGGLIIAVSEALLDANPLHGLVLTMVIQSLMNCMKDEIGAVLDRTEASS